MVSNPKTRTRQSELFLPLLQVLEDAPKGLSAAEATAAVAERLQLSPEQRQEVVELPSGTYRALDRDVRWTRQKAKLAGLVDPSVRNLWTLTAKGKRDLRFAMPGIVVTVFETANGAMLWSTAESAFGHIEDRSLNLIVTSPPYPILRTKDYQSSIDAGDYIDWLVGLSREFKRSLTPDGSLILNLGDAWQSGSPTLNLYQERLLLKLVDDLGYHLAQRCHWHNPAALPSPAQWVTVKRVRLAQKVETLWWLSPSANPKANNANCLVPYSDAMLARLAQGGERGAVRPSGHVLTEGAFSADNGGSIRGNLLTVPNTASNTAYHRHCRDRGLPIHPARFPVGVVEPFVQLTTDPGDVVCDPFSGSGTVPSVAERLGRRWIGIDQSLTYLAGAVGRFSPDALANVA
ncbi:site-specific DNA-methyltransferase [Azospirillum sp. SYSU D00513]|uniref:site-specific DNA-methyltransferase n=1 Tax=Azospirillum sp. SYSU D00513 TaxID=2812561 RepID=UPI001A97CEB8|nr:site-specific DNA-methyltransferase [Azospirillum sp. SYSU D00513]